MRIGSPVIWLFVSTAGIVWFGRGLGLVETLGMLVCGVLAGGALAAVAATRRRAR